MDDKGTANVPSHIKATVSTRFPIALFYHIAALRPQSMPTEKIEVVTEEKLDSASLDIESAEHRQVEKQHVKSPAEKRLFRKINIATMPLVCLVVFVQVP